MDKAGFLGYISLTSGHLAIPLKYFSAQTFTSSGSTSPDTTNDALFGPYQRRKKFLKSSNEAISKSSTNPIGVHS